MYLPSYLLPSMLASSASIASIYRPFILPVIVIRAWMSNHESRITCVREENPLSIE